MAFFSRNFRTLSPAVVLAAAMAATPATTPAQVIPRMVAVPAAPDHGVLPEGAANARYATIAGPELKCEEVTIQAILLTPKVVVGEPVLFRLVIRKPLDAKALVEFRSRLAFGTDVHAYITPQGRARPYEYLGVPVGSNVPTGVISFDQFNVFRIDYRMAMDKDSASGAAFEEPGVYVLSLVNVCGFAAAKTPLRLGEFTITVVPAENDDAKAFDFLKDDFRLFEGLQTHSARFALGSKKMDDTQLALLNRVVEQAPKAALRPYCMQVIAESYIDRDDSVNALKWFRKLMDEYPGSVPADEAAVRIISILEIRGDKSEAREAFLNLWRDPVRSQLTLPGTASWKTYAAPFQTTSTATQWSLFEKPDKDPPVVAAPASQTGPSLTISPEAMEDIRKLGGVKFKGFGEITAPGQ